MWFSNFNLVLGDQVIPNGAVRVENGFIAELRDVPVSAPTYDGGGRMLMPGFVDLHGDMIEREIAPRPNAMMPIEFGIHELDKKLAASGVTTAFAALSFATESIYGHIRSLENTRAIIEGLRRIRSDLLVDHHVHARFEITNIGAAPVLEGLIEAGHIDLMSFTDHTPGQGQYRDIESYVASLSERRAISTAAAAEVVAQRIAIRNASTEVDVVQARMAADARRAGISLASHDDDSPEKVAEMHALGVTISEFPVTLPAAIEARRRGLGTLMGAPNALRGQSMSGNLSALEAASKDVLTMLAADYHPAAFLIGVLKIADALSGNLPAAVAMVTRNPARAAGMSDRGELAVGQRADLVVVEQASVPRVRATFRNGNLVYSDGTLQAMRPASILQVA